MSKKHAKVETVAQQPVEAVTLEGATAKAEPAVLRVKQGLQFRGARAAWYAALLQYEGYTADDYLRDCEKKPPSVPKKGVPEAPSGWLRFFLRTGAATLEARKPE